MSMISCRKVSKWYGEVSALNEVSLEIESGILGLLGPNGAGKSTLLKLMSGQLTPSLGEIELMGQSFGGDPSIFSLIGLCPEQDSLWEEFNGQDFLSGMLRLHGWLKQDADRRASELIGLFGLEFAGKKAVGGYSKGMRQKLRIAQSLAHNPKILFLDEPMTGLDATSRTMVADLIRDLGERPDNVVVVSSHILHEVEDLTKDMVLINEGQLRARGNVYEIRELLTDHPLQLEITTSHPRQLARAFLEKEHVVRVEVDGQDEEKLVVFTKHQNQFFVDLADILEKNDLDIRGLQAEDEDMESVFKYLVH